MISHSSARSRASSHQYVLAMGPATWAQAASLASTAACASSTASARESVVVCTWRNCGPVPAARRCAGMARSYASAARLRTPWSAGRPGRARLRDRLAPVGLLPHERARKPVEHAGKLGVLLRRPYSGTTALYPQTAGRASLLPGDARKLFPLPGCALGGRLV